MNRIGELEDDLIGLSDAIWEFAEVGLQEHKSAESQVRFLESQGFRVEQSVAGMPTAFVASKGRGAPTIAFLGEFDALPGTSQKASPEPDPLMEGAPGHSCGHNLLGTAALGAAVALAQHLDDVGQPGTIRYYGCPAEETLVGKVFMVKAGLFDDVDAALTWHPAMVNAVRLESSSAMNSVKFRFYGRSSHAAGAPEMGRSALDAVELMNIGVNFMREHVIEEARIHYVITDGGGEPNVVPPEAEVWYYMRAPERHEVEEIYARIQNIGRGAALMTDTRMEQRFLSGCYNKRVNRPIADQLWKNMKHVGPPAFSDEDKTFAKEMIQHLPDKQREQSLRNIEQQYGVDLSDQFVHQDLLTPVEPQGRKGGGSTDVADVSWVTPTAEFSSACGVLGAAGHSWQFTATCGMGIGHKGMLQAAKILALTGWDLIADPNLLMRAQETFQEEAAEHPYISPIPDGVDPPLDQLPTH